MDYANIGKVLLKKEDLPKKIIVEADNSSAMILLVIGVLVLAVGIGSFIFAPSVLHYQGSLSVWQQIYMAPGPVTTVGGVIIYLYSALANSNAQKALKGEIERHALDPEGGFPENASLVAVQVEEDVFLDLQPEETATEETATEETASTTG